VTKGFKDNLAYDKTAKEMKHVRGVKETRKEKPKSEGGYYGHTRRALRNTERDRIAGREQTGDIQIGRARLELHHMGRNRGREGQAAQKKTTAQEERQTRSNSGNRKKADRADAGRIMDTEKNLRRLLRSGREVQLSISTGFVLKGCGNWLGTSTRLSIKGNDERRTILGKKIALANNPTPSGNPRTIGFRRVKNLRNQRGSNTCIPIDNRQTLCYEKRPSWCESEAACRVIAGG